MTPKQALKKIKEHEDALIDSIEKESGTSEADLISHFRKQMCQKYPLNDVYHIHSTAYGVQGEPDLLVTHSETDKFFLIECKKAYSMSEAISKLRPDQKARIKEYWKLNKSVYLLWWSGWSKFGKDGWTEGTGNIEEDLK